MDDLEGGRTGIAGAAEVGDLVGFGVFARHDCCGREVPAELGESWCGFGGEKTSAMPARKVGKSHVKQSMRHCDEGCIVTC